MNAVKISPEKLPRDPHQKALVYARLSRTLGINRIELRRSVTDQLRQQPFSTATVKSDVNIDVIGYLRERANQFLQILQPASRIRGAVGLPHVDIAALL